MFIFLHILAAIGSVSVAGAACIKPSVARIRLAYITAAIMISSGIYLLIQSAGHLLEACVTGLIFLGVVSFQIISARRRLARVTVRAHSSE